MRQFSSGKREQCGHCDRLTTEKWPGRASGEYSRLRIITYYRFNLITYVKI